MFGRGESKTPEEKFWKAFEKDVPRLERLYERRNTEPENFNVIISIIGQHIRQYNNDLVFEFGHDGEKFDLVVSAGGIRANIPPVLALKKSMPGISHWKMTAFKPPVPDFGKLGIRIGETDFSFQDARYRLSQPRDGRCDILLAFREGSLPEAMKPEVPGFIFMDIALGEYDVMTKIGHIEFVTFETASEDSLSPLDDLPVELSTLLPEQPS